jgi:ferritin
MLMFVAERGERVLLKAIEGPATSWDSPLAAFENALEHEKIVTGRINNMADLAQGLGDDAARDFLQWYIDEQEEEEETVGGVADKVRLAGDSDDALFMLDKELGARVFMMPAAESE